MIKFVSVNDVIPHTKHGGGGITAFSAIEGLLDGGYAVEVLVIKGKESDNSIHKLALERLGAKVTFLEVEEIRENKFSLRKLRALFFPTLLDMFPDIVHQSRVESALQKMDPDFVFTYHWEALSSIYNLGGFTKIVGVGDPIHAPAVLRRNMYRRLDHKMTARQWLYYRCLDHFWVEKQKRGMVTLLNGCEVKGAFAFHHAKELEALGVEGCNYFRTPVPDVSIPNLEENDKFRILLIGHMIGIATLSGLELFMKDVFPMLINNLGEDNFEVHIVGGFFETMPQSIKTGLSANNIIIRGQVTPAESEFLSADVLLVPTPIELGIRVRIITGFSLGSLIVAHAANAKGIPELESDKNCLLGESGQELAAQIIKVFKNEVDVNAIKHESRLTYEDKFTPRSFLKSIETSIEMVL
jgi:glycosyltransferase involved in cell wall biosynthesis